VRKIPNPLFLLKNRRFHFCITTIKVSGIPVQFWQKDGYISFSDFTRLERFHHYCKGKIATQYCTFQLKKDKSSWIALHDEEHHNTFNSLMKALDYEIAKHFDSWQRRQVIKKMSIFRFIIPGNIARGVIYCTTNVKLLE
jgi:hypothetical protein